MEISMPERYMRSKILFWAQSRPDLLIEFLKKRPEWMNNEWLKKLLETKKIIIPQ
jgi:hypothetical protein